MPKRLSFKDAPEYSFTVTVKLKSPCELSKEKKREIQEHLELTCLQEGADLLEEQYPCNCMISHGMDCAYWVPTR